MPRLKTPVSAFVLIVWLLFTLPLIAAAQDLRETYTFDDGTTFNYSDDMEIYNEEDDSVSLRNDVIDIYIFLVFESTQEREDVVGDLPAILDLFIGDLTDFRPRDADPFELDDGREAFRFEYLVEPEDADPFERLLVILPLEDSPTVVVASVIPPSGRTLNRAAERLALEIINTIRPEGDSTPPDGDMFTFGDGLTVELLEGWTAAEIEDSIGINLQSDDVLILVLPITAQDIEDDDLGTDLDEILLNTLTPLDDSVSIRSNSVEPVELANGVEGVGLLYRENNDGDEYDRLVVVFRLDDDMVIFAGIVPLTETELTKDMQNAALKILGTISVE